MGAAQVTDCPAVGACRLSPSPPLPCCRCCCWCCCCCCVGSGVASDDLRQDWRAAKFPRALCGCSAGALRVHLPCRYLARCLEKSLIVLSPGSCSGPLPCRAMLQLRLRVSMSCTWYSRSPAACWPCSIPGPTSHMAQDTCSRFSLPDCSAGKINESWSIALHLGP